jgi:tripartite-type tricarboxylate transporter receptor subunit TctC
MRFILALLASILTAGGIAAAQDFPSRPVRIIVPLSAGSAFDILSRAIGTRFQERTGQAVVVENRVGGNMSVAANACKAAPPDGYTICIFTQNIILNPLLYAKLSYDPFTDLTPVALASFQQQVLIANKSLPIKTYAELVQYAKDNPGKINYASIGVGSDGHLILEWMRTVSGTDWKHVPFNGSPQALAAFGSGDVHLLLTTAGNVLGQISTGQVKAVMVRGDKRTPLLPDVPSFGESGLPPLTARSWAGFFAPAGVPPAIVAKLSSEIRAIMAEPAFQQRFLRDAALEPAGLDEKAFKAFLAADQAAWAPLIKSSGVTLQ